MKTLKIIQLVGFLLLALGVIIRAGAGEYYGAVIAFFGFFVYVTARVIAWIQSGKP